MALATTGITTSLVGSTLGTTSRSVSTLCTHSAINKWSKKKPVEINNPAPSRNDEWYQGDDGCCGFKQDSIYFDSLDSLVNAYNNNATYIYQPPTGYKRLADFGGYEHNAKSPVFSVDIDGAIYGDNAASSIVVKTIMNLGVSTTNINVQDLAPMQMMDVKNCYYGVVFCTGSRNYIKTSANKVGTDGLDTISDNNYVTITSNDFNTTGTYNVYPLISSLPYTSFTSNLSGTRFVALPTPTSSFETSTTIKASVYEGSISLKNCLIYQTAKLTYQGTIVYANNLEGNNVDITYGYRNSAGENTSYYTQTLELTKTGTYNSSSNYMDFEYSRNGSTATGITYWIYATIGTYSTPRMDCIASLDEGII